MAVARAIAAAADAGAVVREVGDFVGWLPPGFDPRRAERPGRDLTEPVRKDGSEVMAMRRAVVATVKRLTDDSFA